MARVYTTTARNILAIFNGGDTVTVGEARFAHAVTLAMRSEKYVWWINDTRATEGQERFIRALGHLLHMGLEKIEDFMLLYNIGMDDTLHSVRQPPCDTEIAPKVGWTKEVGEWAASVEPYLRLCGVP